MGIKHALLGLLAEKPMHGYELKSAFDEVIGELWSLNIGQVYNTLNLLERDGHIVLQEYVEQESRPDRKVYSITEKGREELGRWLREPLEKPRRLKDDFYLKLIFGSRIGERDVRTLIWNQRKAYLQVLYQLNEIKNELDPATDILTLLLVEGGIEHVEADLRWLDKCEERLSALLRSLERS